MSRRRIWIGVAVAACAGLVALAIVLVTRGATGAAPPRQAVTGETSLSRSGALFADPLRAMIAVSVDRRRIDPSRIGFNPLFEPYDRVGIPQVSRHDAGRLTRLVYSASLVCLTDACLPHGATERVQFPPARIFYWPRSGGGRRTLEFTWRPLTVAARTTEADLAYADPFRQPTWRATTDPLAASYRISPSLLRTLLFVAAGLLFAAAAAALVRFLRAGKVRLAAASPLERAVRLVERTAARDDAPEKRKALELLAIELGRSGERDLALTARELAWAEPTPIPTATQPLTLDVRRVIEERSNGHAR